MPRVTVHLPNDIHDKLIGYAKVNDVSLSSAVAKMSEIGLLVSENQNEKSPLDELSEIEKHCYKLTIQMNAFMKNIAAKQLDFNDDQFEKIRDNSIKKFNQLVGVEPEDL